MIFQVSFLFGFNNQDISNVYIHFQAIISEQLTWFLLSGGNIACTYKISDMKLNLVIKYMIETIFI